MGPEHIGGKIDAAACRMHRQGPHQTGQAVSQARMRRRAINLRTPRAKALGTQGKHRAGCLLHIGFEGAPIGHDFGRHVELAGIDERRDPFGGKSARPQRLAKGVGDRMANGVARASPRDRFAPPVQADGAELGLFYLLGDAGKLDIERTERKKTGPASTRRE